MPAEAINEGTAKGLQDFLDYTTEKGYGTRSAVDPLKIAARKVFSTVEGNGRWEALDVKALDVDEYMDRFAKIAKGEYKHESLVAYRRRVTRAVTAYVKWLADGKPPSMGGATRQASSEAKPSSAQTKTRTNGQGMRTNGGNGSDVVEYRLPLQGNQFATVFVPKKLGKADAERLSTFVRMLHVEPQREIPAKTGEGNPA